MSYAIHPYAVSVEAIKKCVGSRDSQLMKALTRRFHVEFARIDELDADAIPMERAISQLVMGQKADERFGFKYGYALKFLCEHSGKMLTNRYWSDQGWDWIETVDDALANAGIDKKVFRLDPHITTRGSPILLPKITDFPSIGYLLESEIAKVTMELGRLKDGDIDDEEIRESVSEVRKWLDHCARTHHDLVCFYH